MKRALSLVLLLPFLSAAEQPDDSAAALQAQRDAAFAEMVADSTWESSWHAKGEDGLDEGGQNRYRIIRAQKVNGDDWIILGEFELQGKQVRLPLPAKVFWADDTPVLSMTGLPLPGEPLFTVRILFKGDMFSGVFQSNQLSGALVGMKVKGAQSEE